MLVYVVQQELLYEPSEIEGIYADAADADKAAAALNKEWQTNDYYATPFELL